MTAPDPLNPTAEPERESDTYGRPYARLSELRPGDRVIVDDGFECMGRWTEREVYQTHDVADEPTMAIKCRSGGHTLDGQLAADGDSLIGIYRKEGFDPNAAGHRRRKSPDPDKPQAAGVLL